MSSFVVFFFTYNYMGKWLQITFATVISKPFVRVFSLIFSVIIGLVAGTEKFKLVGFLSAYTRIKQNLNSMYRCMFYINILIQ